MTAFRIVTIESTIKMVVVVVVDENRHKFNVDSRTDNISTTPFTIKKNEIAESYFKTRFLHRLNVLSVETMMDTKKRKITLNAIEIKFRFVFEGTSQSFSDQEAFL
jgi:hypothetical protein